VKLPRDISGRALVTALCREWGYVTIHQTGSHVILETAEPFHQRIAIPDHRSLRIGTLNSILRAVAKHKGVRREKILTSV
jgi:predicted RNA binding protein YcfA (HicA-like mRNA interferase family)